MGSVRHADHPILISDRDSILRGYEASAVLNIHVAIEPNLDKYLPFNSKNIDNRHFTKISTWDFVLKNESSFVRNLFRTKKKCELKQYSV